jgi:hypothetical protein
MIRVLVGPQWTSPPGHVPTTDPVSRKEDISGRRTPCRHRHATGDLTLNTTTRLNDEVTIQLPWLFWYCEGRVQELNPAGKFDASGVGCKGETALEAAANGASWECARFVLRHVKFGLEAVRTAVMSGPDEKFLAEVGQDAALGAALVDRLLVGEVYGWGNDYSRPFRSDALNEEGEAEWRRALNIARILVSFSTCAWFRDAVGANGWWLVCLVVLAALAALVKVSGEYAIAIDEELPSLTRICGDGLDQTCACWSCGPLPLWPSGAL